MDRPDRRTLLAAGVLAGAAAASGVAAKAPRPPSPWTGEGFVQRAAGRIHYVELGPKDSAREPLVLLHKLGGWVEDWAAIAPMLARDRRVIAIDLPGHGQSLMRGPPPYVQTVPESAAMLKAVLDELELSRVTVAGSSLGGITGIVMASFWPDLVSRLALISVSLSVRRPYSALAAMDAEVRSNFGPRWEPIARSGKSVDRFGSVDPRINDAANRSRAKAGVWVRPSERGVAVAGVEDYLPRVAAPTLLIYADRGLYRQWEAVGRARLRQVTVERIADTGSFTHQEKPAETAAALNRFLGDPA